MILRNATIKYKGYDPDDLKPKSQKRICCSCDRCGRVRWLMMQNYKDLCYNCSMKPPKPKYVKEQDRFIPETGIDRILTIEKFGYDPTDLKNNSNRKVCCICQQCSKIRFVIYRSHHILCGACAQKCKPPITNETRKKLSISMKGKHAGENNPMYGTTGEKCPSFGIVRSKEQRIKMSCIKQNINKEDFIGFIGRHPNRDYVIVTENCTKLNTKFDGSEFHHIMSGVGVYIPKELHRSIWHNIKSGKGINEINKLAMSYLVGDI